MTRRLFAALVASALLMALVVPGGITAKDPQARFQRPDLRGVDLKALKFTPQALEQNKPIRVIVELDGTPVTLRERDALAQGKSLTKADKAAIRGQVKTSQDKVAKQIQDLGGKVLASFQDAYNGIRVQTTPRQVATIARLPGVVAVHPVTLVAPPVPNNVNSVPYIGAPATWSDTGFTGAGVKIAIIDTGIDYYHANLGGSGNPADFANANRTSLADGGFPSAKVAGGYDFAGDDYNADSTSPNYQPIPHPDPDPLDCIFTSGDVGHGSHVAGTAAGNGVLADGTAYRGPYNAATVSGHTWKIGPGVAPQATLYAYRVFGCAGSTDLVIDAINRAVSDGVDVINMSLGGPFGTADDPDAVAANNAALAGVVVVASSGNSGADNVIGSSSPAFITGSPASGDRVISVAALDAVPSFPGARIVLQSGPITAINANSGSLPVTGRLRVLLTPPDTTGNQSMSLGCDAADYDPVVSGDIVVTQRGVCARVDRAILGQAAGAGAVVMVNNASGLPPFEGEIPGVTIPFLGVLSSDGDALKAADGEVVTISPVAALDNPTYKSIVDFSSGGPREGDNAPKPDIAAPGVGVVSTASGTGTGAQTLSGTSMASPATAGAAALVVQAHPTWTAEQVKSALMNTANASSGPGGILGYDVRREGAGVVAARRAVDTVGLATTQSGRSSLAFGYAPHDGAYTETQTVTLWNTSSRAIAYTLSRSFAGGSLGASVSVSPASISVPAHGHAKINVKITMSANALAAQSLDVSGGASLVTVAGAVVATPKAAGPGRYPLRVPFLVSPRGLSNVTPDKSWKYTLSAGVASAKIPVTNSGIHSSTLDTYAWGLTDANDGLSTNDIRAVGVQALPAEVLTGAADPSDRGLIFAVNTYGRWGSASVNEIDVAIDVNKDGVTDYYVIGVDAGLVLTGLWSGDQVSLITDGAGHPIDLWVATAPANGSTMELPALATDLGLASGSSSFDYTVTAYNLFTNAIDPASGVGHFDPFAPAVSQGDYIPLKRGGSVKLPVSVNKANFAANPALGWMLVALDDANGGAQADLVPVRNVR